MKRFSRLSLTAVLAAWSISLLGAEIPGQWSTEKAKAWHDSKPWLVGCNFGPSTAINQLEMWQVESFDLATIRRELKLAQDLGFTSVRVFLHHLPYEQDPTGFTGRMEQFLEAADQHGIGVMFVLFDGVWDPFFKAGPQRAPKAGVHNSGWVQSPGLEILKDPAKQDALKPYLQGVIKRFSNDKRIHAWDIFNEPDNPNTSSYGAVELKNKAEAATQLLKKSFAWAREVNPSQPLTAGVWIGTWGDPAKLSPMEKFMLEDSDIITFHNYAKLEEVKQCVENLKRYQRPVLCTEYMARPRGSTFDPILAYFKANKVGAYNWGFVAGKTQTIIPWDSWQKAYTKEPAPWFHDIFRADGTPFNQQEVDYIKTVTGKGKKQASTQ